MANTDRLILRTKPLELEGTLKTILLDVSSVGAKAPGKRCPDIACTSPEAGGSPPWRELVSLFRDSPLIFYITEILVLALVLPPEP